MTDINKFTTEELMELTPKIIGKSCCFTGHRPNKLYGYDLANEKYMKLTRKIQAEIVKLIETRNVKTFISGGALGVDIIAFMIVDKLKGKYPDIKNILAIPFLNQDCKWNVKDSRRYNRAKEIADDVIYVDCLEKYSIKGLACNDYHPAKMQKRNEYMVDKVDFIIAIWDEKKKGGTWNCVKYALSQDKTMINIKP